MRQAGRIAFLAVLCGLSFVRPAAACTCAGSKPVCQTFWSAAAVFVGQVQSIDALPATGPSLFLSRRVHFRVQERFAGVSDDQVDILTGRGDGDCGYKFAIGSSYLVFANSTTDHHLATGICDRTKPLAEASGDLEYLRGLQAMHDTRARIYGTARFWDVDEDAGRSSSPQPFEGARITVGGPAGRFTTLSGADGSFEIRVPVGEYRLMTEVPSGKYATFWAPSMVVPDPRACFNVDVSVHSDGLLSGRVVDSRRRPVAGLTIEAGSRLAIDRPYFYSTHTARTSPDGRFTIKNVPPGAYVIGFNLERGSGSSPLPRVLDSIAGPQVPAVFHLAAGKRADVGDFFLPDAVPLATVSGNVRRDDGQSPAGATVYVSSAENGNGVSAGQPVTVDDSGHFSFTVVSDHAYSLQAFWQAAPTPGAQRIRSDAATVTAGTEVHSVVLVLKSVRSPN